MMATFEAEFDIDDTVYAVIWDAARRQYVVREAVVDSVEFSRYDNTTYVLDMGGGDNYRPIDTQESDEKVFATYDEAWEHQNYLEACR
jgi:hypothetical protein